MYKPIQVPYLLNNQFSEAIEYNEYYLQTQTDFIICTWEMLPKSNRTTSVTNVIICDGCIDLVVDFNNKTIGFCGMSKTNFNFQIDLPSKYFGIRFTPGTFYQLTNLSAEKAIDNFLDIDDVFPFDFDLFWSLDFTSSKQFLLEFIENKLLLCSPSEYTTLFSQIQDSCQSRAFKLYERFNFSPRQTQRLFKKYYGLTPKQVLSIIRFQNCLKLLLDQQIDQQNLSQYYYDQSHYLGDFKRNIGITPSQLINLYK